MPASILSALTSNPGFNATNELTGNVVWTDLGVIDVEIHSSSANTDMPMSNQQENQSGGTYTSILTADIEAIKIIQPSGLRVTALCANISTLENIIATFLDETSTISINTKSIITSFLVMTELDIEQTAEMISASKIVMTFEQAQPPANSGYAPEQAGDSSVYGVSIQTPPSITPLATLAKAVGAASFIPTTFVAGSLIDSNGGPFILDSSKLS